MAQKQTPPPPLPVWGPVCLKRYPRSLIRSNSLNLEARTDILMMSWRLSDAGKGALVIREIITRMNTSCQSCTHLSLETPLRCMIVLYVLFEPLMLMWIWVHYWPSLESIIVALSCSEKNITNFRTLDRVLVRMLWTSSFEFGVP